MAKQVSERYSQEVTARRLSSIGDNVRRARKAAHLRQVELHRRTGLSPQRISEIEAGRYDRPALDALMAIAAALPVSLDQLVLGINQTFDETRPVVHGTMNERKGSPALLELMDPDRWALVTMLSQIPEKALPAVQALVACLIDIARDTPTPAAASVPAQARAVARTAGKLQRPRR